MDIYNNSKSCLSNEIVYVNVLMYFIIIVARAFLDQDSYTVSEKVGVVEGCVVLDGFIEREVVINLFTVDGTARGNREYLV